jgi:protein TonB
MQRPPAAPVRPSLRDQIAGLGSGLSADADAPAKQTINLDDRQPRFSDYLARLKRRIQSEWAYPEEADRVGMGGELVLVFTLNTAGSLTYIRLVDSSGFPVLDNEALRAVKTAAPFDAFPPQMGHEPVNIVAHFAYYSRYRYRRN